MNGGCWFPCVWWFSVSACMLEWKPSWNFLFLGWEAGCSLGGWEGCILGLWMVRELVNRLGLAWMDPPPGLLSCQLLLASLLSFFREEIFSFFAARGLCRRPRGAPGLHTVPRLLLLPSPTIYLPWHWLKEGVGGLLPSLHTSFWAGDVLLSLAPSHIFSC